MTPPETHEFLERCREAYELVQGYMADSLPWGPVPPRRPGYVYSADVRAGVKAKVTLTMEKMATAIDRHGLCEIAISYNGGKDCLVMLILLLATIHKKFFGDLSTIPRDYKLDSIYINSEVPFAEVSAFIDTSTEQYGLNPIMIKSSLKEGFEKYLSDINTSVKCIIVGIRRSDPYGDTLDYEQPTDHHWPAFLRIHPILHWNYVDVWDFLLGCDLDYCVMYDWGYTSLGGINNTTENPYLKGESGFLPAYMLKENADERERLGRNKP